MATLEGGSSSDEIENLKNRLATLEGGSSARMVNDVNTVRDIILSEEGGVFNAAVVTLIDRVDTHMLADAAVNSGKIDSTQLYYEIQSLAIGEIRSMYDEIKERAVMDIVAHLSSNEDLFAKLSENLRTSNQ